MKKIQVIFASLVICLIPIAVRSQTIPRPQLPAPQPPPDLETLPSLEELLPKPLPPTETIPPEGEILETIIVKQFIVIGSTVFSESELSKILEPFTNRPLSLSDLIQAGEAITKLYYDTGYVTSGAFIPPQEIKDNLVTIQVIEGKIEEIEITGLNRLKPSYVRKRIEIASKPPVDLEKLVNALQLLQLDPLIANLSAELTPGVSPGSNILVINVKEARALQGLLSVDNYRNPSVGSNRLLGQITHENLIGYGDRFNLRYYITEGSDSIDDLSYRFFLNPRNGTFSLRHRRAKSSIIQEPFDQLDIDSKYRQYEISYRQPLLQTPSQEFALGIAGDWQQSNTTVLDIPFPLSRGAEDDGFTRVTAVRFFQEYSHRNNRQVLLVRSQFSLGVNAFNATVNYDEPDGEFFAWRGQLQYLRLLTPDTSLLLRGDLQLTPNSLVSLEQYSLGGVYSVRGYPQDALIADNGLFLSAEFRGNIIKFPKLNTIVQLGPFFDFGTVWNSDNFPLLTQTLYSTGLTLQILAGKRFRGRLDWGIPLTDFDTTGDSLQENGFYFGIEFTP